MTPQEQIEEQYGHEKLIGVCRVSGDWIEVQSTDEPCPHPGCDCGLAFFRSIRFDSPQISEGEVAVTLSREEIEAIFEAMSPGYSHEGPMDQHLKAVYPKLRETRACLSAALTQKGDNE